MLYMLVNLQQNDALQMDVHLEEIHILRPVSER